MLDNLNIHFRGSFVEVLGPKQAQLLLERVEFHYSPKHASWLNMAEIEIGILERQCLNRRIAGSLKPTAASSKSNHARTTAPPSVSSCRFSRALTLSQPT